MRLLGKKALVTAAGQGIGLASVLALAREGAQVWATDIDELLLERYAGTPNASTSPGSTSSTAPAIGAPMFATLPTLDVLFNCAGFVHKRQHARS